MKERITYVIRDPDAFSPDQLRVNDTAFDTHLLPAAKERRLSFSFAEIPHEVRLFSDSRRAMSFFR